MSCLQVLGTTSWKGFRITSNGPPALYRRRRVTIIEFLFLINKLKWETVCLKFSTVPALSAVCDCGPIPTEQPGSVPNPETPMVGAPRACSGSILWANFSWKYPLLCTVYKRNQFIFSLYFKRTKNGLGGNQQVLIIFFKKVYAMYI